MAQNSEFYLPPQFLTDDEKRFVNHLFTNSKNDDVFNGFSTTLFPYFISPSETETKSDENEYINELTRRMAHSTLQHQVALNNKGSSPQSTLNAFDNGSFGNGTNRNGAVLNLNSQRATNDLLHADAEKVEWIHRLNNEEAFYGFAPKKPSVFHTQNHLSISQKQLQLQLQKAQIEMLKKQWLKQREELLARGCGVFSQRQSCNYQNILDRGTDNETVFPGKVGLSPSAWPSVQKIGNNNKAVFPGNPNLKKERTGTGVFLPRFVDTESSRKKPASRNVVVPERVVHALNRKVDEGVIRGYMQEKNRFNGALNFENGFGNFLKLFYSLLSILISKFCDLMVTCVIF
ncbi:hypothetical protein KIW84_076601 [Lathyrus oleraceus]|uniref:Uncharacterized protein n=1 Tax=Pisum sativum TaxID=3888 RepID=A0A9D4VZN6_PEA|nr:hypothetical protein KIW84_076601 [Pisum sativum]